MKFYTSFFSLVFFLSVHHLIPRKNFLRYLMQVVTPQAFEIFHHSSIFNKAVFCLNETPGMLINDKCSSWYNKVGDFLMLVWNMRKGILSGNCNGQAGGVSQNNFTPECEVNDIECYDG